MQGWEGVKIYQNHFTSFLMDPHYKDLKTMTDYQKSTTRHIAKLTSTDLGWIS
jgi:hypothetical protein